MKFLLPLLTLLPTLLLAAEKPNIIFLLADDLGSYDVGWRGGKLPTPHLDSLAKGGAQLDQFYVQPVCTPTRAAFLTGRYPSRYGLQVRVIRPWADYGLPLDERLLPQALKEVGYETAITGKWHLGHFQPEYLPTHRGFDHQYGHYNGAIDYFKHDRDGGHDWHRNDQPNYDEGYSTTLIASEAVKRIEGRDKSRPFFLYVPFNGVHSPFQAPEKDIAAFSHLKGNRKLYAAMLASLDEGVGKILSALDKEKLRENTLIIFSSDNGGPNPGPLTDNGPLRAGKGTLYEGGVRVAAFANWPGKIPAGSKVETPIHISDWYPTLLKLAGASLEQKHPLDGHDILPTLTEGKPSSRQEVLINTTPDNGALRVGDWKYVHHRKPGDNQTNHELYNLTKDLSEKNNLATTEPAKLEELKARYNTLAAAAAPVKEKSRSANFKAPKVWGHPDGKEAATESKP